jgi:AmmeMemoRadiSam system protein B
VPVGVPPVKKSIEIGKAVAEIARETGTSVKAIGSTDLTHYGVNYGFMPRGTGPEAIEWVRQDNDKKIIDAMLALEPEKVLAEAGDNQNACCAGAVSAVLGFAGKKGVDKGQFIAYTNSYEKNPGSSFVGYTGILY